MTAARSVARSTSSFKPRRRRMSESRRADLDRWMERWGLDATGPELDWGIVGGTGTTSATPRGVVLDIGFGHGESVLDLARRRPDLSVVGIEVHTPGVATVLDAVAREELANVQVVHGDALAFLDRVPGDSLSEVRAFFPDPWPKERQHHRRLVRPDVVAAFTDRLRVGGTLRLATDVEEYADSMDRACGGEPRLRGGTVDRVHDRLDDRLDDRADGRVDDRPVTRFERRAISEGRGVTDLRFERIG
jgi:tRNA (guanine-N7-)-methyltransferase